LIRVDALWLAVEPLDMRTGTEAALRRVVTVFGAELAEQAGHNRGHVHRTSRG